MLSLDSTFTYIPYVGEGGVGTEHRTYGVIFLLYLSPEFYCNRSYSPYMVLTAVFNFRSKFDNFI